MTMTPEMGRALAALTTGIYVLTVREGTLRHGMSSSWVTQVSGAPPLLSAALDRRHQTHAIVERTGWFALNVVGHTSRTLEDYFFSSAAQRPHNLDELDWQDSPTGLPFLRDAFVNLECRVCDRMTAGDHTIFVASVESVRHGGTDRALTSLDLEYVYVGTVIKRQP